MMYMKISLSDFLTVFAARTRKPFFSRMPGGLLFGAATVALGTSTLFSAYWPFPELKPLEWSLLGIVRTPAQLLASPCVLIGLTRACARYRSGPTASSGSCCRTLPRSSSST